MTLESQGAPVYYFLSEIVCPSLCTLFPYLIQNNALSFSTDFCDVIIFLCSNTMGKFASIFSLPECHWDISFFLVGQTPGLIAFVE